MRLFLISFAVSAILTASTAFAENDEPLSTGSKAPGSARFEVTPVQQYLTAKARADVMHRTALMQYYDWAGVDYGRPLINAGVFTLAQPPMRTRRIYAFPGQYVDVRSSGYSYGY